MAVDVEKLIRPHLTDIQTYDPVDPPELLAKRAGIAPDKVVKLNGNENPYGGSPKAAAAVANREATSSEALASPRESRVYWPCAGIALFEPRPALAPGGAEMRRESILVRLTRPGHRAPRP